MAASIAPPQAFDYTATGTLGDKRDTMLENELLLRVSNSTIAWAIIAIIIIHNRK